jgi:hypothetical protein
VNAGIGVRSGFCVEVGVFKLRCSEVVKLGCSRWGVHVGVFTLRCSRYLGLDSLIASIFPLSGRL